MKYDRLVEIYNDMGYEMQHRFITKYQIIPAALDESQRYFFNNCMQEFLNDNRNHLAIQRACEIFPELKDIPHPDRIPETWGLTYRGRELLKNAYIEKIELENSELKNELYELRSMLSKTKCEECKLKNLNQEPVQTACEPPVDGNTDDAAASLYQKLFVPPIAQNRLQLLTDQEIEWAIGNVELTEQMADIFSLCCKCESYRQVAEKTGLTLSKIKRVSAANITAIRLVLEQYLPHVKQEVEE